MTLPLENTSSGVFRDTKNLGQIQLIIGPMFSGKTTELMRRMKRYQLANYDCMIIKYSRDVRYNEKMLATHDCQTLPALSAEKLWGLEDAACDKQIIGIDEGQFFSDVVSFSERLAELGKTVIVAALDGTYQRKGFPEILELIPLSESVIKLTAVCMNCFGEASFTKRIGQEKEIEIIGGADKYLATCRLCFSLPPIKQSPRRAGTSHLRPLNGVASNVKTKLFSVDVQSMGDKENMPNNVV